MTPRETLALVTDEQDSLGDETQAPDESLAMQLAASNIIVLCQRVRALENLANRLNSRIALFTGLPCCSGEETPLT